MMNSVIRNECMYMLAGGESFLATTYFIKWLGEYCNVERTTKSSLLNHLSDFRDYMKHNYEQRTTNGTIIDDAVVSIYTDNFLLDMQLVGWDNFYYRVHDFISNYKSDRITLSKFYKALDDMALSYFYECMNNADMERDKRIDK